MNPKGTTKSVRESNDIARRGQIIGLWKAGKSRKDIAEELGCARSTVGLWIRRFVLYFKYFQYFSKILSSLEQYITKYFRYNISVIFLKTLLQIQRRRESAVQK